MTTRRAWNWSRGLARAWTLLTFVLVWFISIEPAAIIVRDWYLENPYDVLDYMQHVPTLEQRLARPILQGCAIIANNIVWYLAAVWIAQGFRDRRR